MIVGSGYELTSASKTVRILRDFESFSFHFVVSGTGSYTIRNKTYTVGKGQIFCIFPDEPIEYKPTKKNPWTYFWINFTGSKALSFLSHIGASPDNPIIKVSNPSIKRAFVRNVLECEDHPEIADQIALSNFYRITSLLYISQSLEHSSSSSSRFIDNTFAYINKHYRNPQLTIATVAKNLSISAAHLSRLFKKETGMTFTSVLTSTRLKVAVHLMNNGVTNLSEIAETIGFNDPYYFSKIFKQKYGEAPSMYIKNSVKKSGKH